MALNELDLDSTLEKQTDAFYSRILSSIMQEEKSKPSHERNVSSNDIKFWDFNVQKNAIRNSSKKKIQKRRKNETLNSKKTMKSHSKHKYNNSTKNSPSLNETQLLIEQALTLLLNHSLPDSKNLPDEIYSEAKDYWNNLHNISNSSKGNTENKTESRNISSINTTVQVKNTSIPKESNASHTNVSQKSLNSSKGKEESVFSKAEKKKEKPKVIDELPSLFEAMVPATKPSVPPPVPQLPPFTPQQMPKFTQVSDFFDEIEKAHAEKNPSIDESSFVSRVSGNQNEEDFSESSRENGKSTSENENSKSDNTTSSADSKKNISNEEENKMMKGLDRVSKLLENYLGDSDDEIQSISQSFANPPQPQNLSSFPVPTQIPTPSFTTSSPPIQLNQPKSDYQEPPVALKAPNYQLEKESSPRQNANIEENVDEKKFLRFERESDSPLIPHFFSFSF